MNTPSENITSADSGTHGTLVLDDRIVDCNERFCRILECDRDTVVGKALLSLCPEVQSDGALSIERWQRRWQAARGGQAQWFPWQFRNCHGRRVHALVHLSGDTRDGAPLRAHVHDLSNLRHAGWIKPETQERLQRVLDHTKAVIFVKDRSGRYVFANRELERVVRMPAGRIMGRTDAELWPADVAAHFQANDAQVLRERSAAEFEVTADVGRQRKTFLSFKFPLFGADGEPYAVCGVATDITDPKRTQDALTNAALAVSSAQGSTVYQELVRYLATILEVDAAFIAAPHEPDSTQMCVHAFYLDGETQQNFEYPKAGTPCSLVIGQAFRIYPSGVQQTFPEDDDLRKLGFESYAGYPLSDGSGAPLGLIAAASRRPMVNAELIESILKIFAVRASAELERQHAEETLRRSEASYRTIFEASEDGVFVHDWDSGALIDVNRRVCEMTGYGYDEIKAMTIAELSSGVYPYTGEEAAKRIAEAKTGRTVRFEWQSRSKDRSLHWYEIVLRPAVIAGQQRILAFAREITERKLAEQALRQAQKMEALGHLTGGIAHDFNNLLTSIMGYIVLASDQPAAQDAKLGKYLEQAQHSCTRARDLIQQMLTFSRGQRGQPRPVALASLVEQSVRLFGAAVPATVEVRTDLCCEVPPVMLDPVHLDQILLNLCINARDAMNGRGTIRISVVECASCEETCTACRQAASGGYVELRVEDEGPGIAPDVVDRIFEPFFTTKDVGKGSGMGLASVHGIVHELGGHIVVENAAPHGTRFRVLFPALGGESGEAGASSAACIRAPLCCLSGRVLVVDDEQAVSGFMCDLLESWGLRVTTAPTANDALDLFTHDAAPFDIVITDHKMPGMTGLQLACELHAANSQLPVILYTGFNEGLARGDIDKAQLRAVVTKPIDPHELFGLLQTHLPRPTA
ncbi:MAG: histidine kinase [Betaproteobacteria bacterium]|nr:histidine kinase [Betaproteobacteria bacterium]